MTGEGSMTTARENQRILISDVLSGRL